jgi:uncharacterized surface anchored protein
MKMRFLNLIFLVALFYVISACSLSAQELIAPCPTEKERKRFANTVVELKNSFTAIALTGIVKFNEREAVEDVVIERLTSIDGVCIESTQTDSNGKFSFPNLPTGKYYLRLSKAGYNITILKVVIKKKAKQTELELPIQSGT